MFEFAGISIKSRLVAAIAAMSVLLLFVGGIGLFGMAKAKDEMFAMYQNSVLPAQQLSDIQRLLFSSRMSIADSLANPSAGGIKKSTAEVEGNIEEIGRIWGLYMSNAFLSRDDKLLTDNFSRARYSFENEVLLPVIRALRANELSLADQILWEKVNPNYRAVDDALQKLTQMQIDDGQLNYAASVRHYEATRTGAIALIGGGIVLAIWLGITMFFAITRPLASALKLAGAVAQGDLTHHIEVTSSDELGQLLQVLQDMNQNLVGIVSNVHTSSMTITTASQELAAGNNELSFRTEEQAANLEETAASMQELTEMVQQTAENAAQANQLASNASQVATKGGQAVGNVVQTMSSISDSSRRIVDIISVIDGIAFQTNILALNAAVEAARAGEHGRGFSVVAGEVRNLAQRSASAAKEIKMLIDDSVKQVETGSMQVEQAGQTMNDIVQAVQRVTHIMAEISVASNEQRKGIEQVNRAITQMDTMTQQNAALVEESVAATEAMQNQAEIMADAVSNFRLETTAGDVSHAFSKLPGRYPELNERYEGEFQSVSMTDSKVIKLDRQEHSQTERGSLVRLA